MINHSDKKIKILFLGRKNCISSEIILNKLKSYDFEVQFFESKQRKEKINKLVKDWRGDFIISFRNLMILPEEVLKKASIMALNFHPGPPEFPGSGCINFALYNEEESYGVTAHVMNEKVDNGKILEVRRFKILESDNLESLLKKTHKELFLLCID